MRGKVLSIERRGGTNGITPAYAGKSEWKLPKIKLPQDHPCVCGEKLETLRDHDPAVGSPLRMRGKERSFLCVRAGFRITPAYAGKRKT